MTALRLAVKARTIRRVFAAAAAVLVLGLAASPAGASSFPEASWSVASSSASSSLSAPLSSSGLSSSAATPDSHAPQARHVCGTPAAGAARCDALVRTDTTPKARFAATAGPSVSGHTPATLQAAYGLSQAAASDGSGRTIAVIDAYDAPHAEADLGVYRAQFGLPACTTANGCFRKVNQSGGTTYPAYSAGWATEISLDLEMASAICPNCRLLLVEASSDALSNLGTAVNRAVAMGAKFISNSYVSAESSSETSWDASYYNHPGVVITASAGDSGYGVSFPAASPHVVAVGGTSLTADGQGGWKQAAWSSTGSGCSRYEPKPSWQHDAGCARRTVADISAVADPDTPVAVYCSMGDHCGGWLLAGGTSASAPIVAAAYALAGVPAVSTYPAAYPYVRGGLTDVVGGSNGSCGGSYLCTGVAGYDGPTGLGTPNGTSALTFAAPGAPRSVTGTPGNGAVAVSWLPPASSGGAPITGYTATADPGGARCTWTSGPLECTVSGLDNGTVYTFTVTATNAAGVGPASDPSTSVVPGPLPGSPTSVVVKPAAPTYGALSVTWAAPSDDGGSPITAYTATAYVAGTFAPTGQSCTSNDAPPVTACVITGLTPGRAVVVRVTATNRDTGTGLASPPSAPVTPPTAPSASVGAEPTFSLATPLKVTWTGSRGTQPIASYDVRYRRAAWNGSFGSFVAWRTATTATSASLALSTGTTYCFSVRARDVLGFVSAWSAERCTAMPLDDRSLAHTSSWTPGVGSAFYRGTWIRSYTYGAAAYRTSVQAKRIAIVATTCPACGSVRVYLGSTLLKTVSLVSSTTVYRRVITVAVFSSVRAGTVTVKLSSSGRRVYLDGLAISRT
jgi:hypothetical protein